MGLVAVVLAFRFVANALISYPFAGKPILWKVCL